MTRNRSFRPRNAAAKPTRVWVSANTGFLLSSITTTSSSIVMQMQQPTDVTNLTADPPEDITILRVVGEFSVNVDTACIWVVGLTVQDTTWTPATLWPTDADKRWLWVRAFNQVAAEAGSWSPPGLYRASTASAFPGEMEMTRVDIAPKVKLEAGKALFLVAYEQGGASTMTLTGISVRLLFQRARRR